MYAVKKVCECIAAACWVGGFMLMMACAAICLEDFTWPVIALLTAGTVFLIVALIIERFIKK